MAYLDRVLTTPTDASLHGNSSHQDVAAVLVRPPGIRICSSPIRKACGEDLCSHQRGRPRVRQSNVELSRSELVGAQFPTVLPSAKGNQSRAPSSTTASHPRSWASDQPRSGASSSAIDRGISASQDPAFDIEEQAHNDAWAAQLQMEGIKVSMTAAAARWQNGRAEIHGKIVKDMLKC